MFSSRPLHQENLIPALIAATLFVGGLATIFYFLTFPPSFRGWGEANAEYVAGWAVDEAAPSKRVEVQLYIDGRFAGDAVANLPRPDVVAAGRSKDEWCGYSFKTPALAPGEHEVRVYAVHTTLGGRLRTLRLLGDPLRFTVSSPAPSASANGG